MNNHITDGRDAEMLALADREAAARARYAETDIDLIRESKLIESALRSAALPKQADPSREELREVLKAEIKIIEERYPNARGFLEKSLHGDAMQWRRLTNALALSAPVPSPDGGAIKLIERCAKIAKSFKYSEETKQSTNGARTYGNDEACDKIALAISALSTSPDGAGEPWQPLNREDTLEILKDFRSRKDTVDRAADRIEAHIGTAISSALKMINARYAHLPTGAAEPDAVRTLIVEACDLLAERKYGNQARSAGHNARLVLEAALRLPARAPAVGVTREKRIKVSDVIEILESAARDARVAGISGHKALIDIAALMERKSAELSPVPDATVSAEPVAFEWRTKEPTFPPRADPWSYVDYHTGLLIKRHPEKYEVRALYTSPRDEGREATIEALKPFSDIGLDVLKNRPGWANHVFSGTWCTYYDLKYTDFERAAAVYIALAANGGGR